MTVEDHQLAHGAMVWLGLGELPQQLVPLRCQSVESAVQVRKRPLEPGDVRSGGPGVRAVQGVLRNRGVPLRIIIEMLMETQFLGDQLPLASQFGDVVIEPQDAALQQAHIALRVWFEDQRYLAALDRSPPRGAL